MKNVSLKSAKENKGHFSVNIKTKSYPEPYGLFLHYSTFFLIF